MEMGARHTLDLTGEVTHLLVADIRTPKYRYVAKSRPDIKVLHPDWIQEIRQSWLEGEDPDVALLEAKWKYPTLAGLHMCITGITESSQRVKLEETFKQNGSISMNAT